MKTAFKIIIIVLFSCIAAAALFLGGIALADAFDIGTESETKAYALRDTFHNISVNVVESDIEFAVSSDTQCKVICSESSRIRHNVTIEDDTLVITRTDTRKWYERLDINLFNDYSVTVYLPEGIYASLNALSISGKIEVTSGLSFDNVNLSSTSGNISFLGTANEQLDILTISGGISIQNLLEGNINAISTSGKVELSNISANNLYAKSISGKIELSFVVLNDAANIETVSGRIELNRCDASSFDINTVSGKVEGSLLSSKNFITSTASGNVQVPYSDSSAGECKIETTSGNINIEIAA